MKQRVLMMFILVAIASSLTAYGAMIKRTDVIWARNASGPITLDGKLTEADWASAESLNVIMGQNNGWPGSGWWWQSGAKPGTDPTNATVKFLVNGDNLYVAFICRDKSVGAVADWAHFDEFITNLRYPQPTGVSGTPGRDGNTQQNYEITYGYYCGSDWGDTLAGTVGGTPGFMGFAGSQNIWPRPDSLKAIWDAVTTVQGTANDDATPDTSWTTEFVFNLAYFGYNPQQAGGDIAMYNFSIWDYDYAWPVDTIKNSSTTVWEQGVWGNASAYSHLRIYMRPDVTTSSGAVPTVGPDWTIPVAGNYAAPVIDGKLNDPVWASAPSLQMKYGDGALRAAYPSTMKWRSGQTQYTVNGSTNPVIDPSLATVKYFVKADTLYLGFDVKDKFVQSVKLPDGSYDGNRQDGFDVIFNDRGLLDGDSIFARHDFAFIVDSAGGTKKLNDLALGGWDSVNCVRVKIGLNSGTTVDTSGTQADSGYTAEMAIDLTKLGYPDGLGDGVAWFSLIFWDGDSFTGGSYGTKTWIGRPGGWDDGPAWFYIDQSTVLAVNSNANAVPVEFALLGNYPNPFNPSTTIKFQVPQQSEITLDVYDVIGRLVASKSLGIRQAGEQSVSFDASALASGTYLYRLKMASTGATLVGKMMLLK
jgi:hypothetical protein